MVHLRGTVATALAVWAATIHAAPATSAAANKYLEERSTSMAQLCESLGLSLDVLKDVCTLPSALDCLLRGQVLSGSTCVSTAALNSNSKRATTTTTTTRKSSTTTTTTTTRKTTTTTTTTTTTRKTSSSSTTTNKASATTTANPNPSTTRLSTTSLSGSATKLTSVSSVVTSASAVIKAATSTINSASTAINAASTTISSAQSVISSAGSAVSSASSAANSISSAASSANSLASSADSVVSSASSVANSAGSVTASAASDISSATSAVGSITSLADSPAFANVSTTSLDSSATSALVSATGSVVPTLTPVANATTGLNSTGNLNTTLATNATCSLTGGCSVDATILIIVKDAASASSASSGLNGYGIPYYVLTVPQAGVTLPALNSSAGGNFGGIIVDGEVAYDYGATGWGSALTTDQWNQLFAYQVAYGVRMVQYNVYPGPKYGATAIGGCCTNGEEQFMTFTDTSDFVQAGMTQGAQISTQGLYHYTASVADSSTTKEIAQFAPNSQYSSSSTAAVVNNFSGRQQMVFFMSWATDWSPTSNYLQHAYITYLTHGLYAGFRRVYFNAQIDDMMMQTAIYYPGNFANIYRLTKDDISAVAAWVPKINAKMNPGSKFKPELGHNGNGNILFAQAQTKGATVCAPGAIELNSLEGTSLEWIKPLGSGTDQWPPVSGGFPYTTACMNLDPLKVFFDTPANRDQFMHISHTYTHLSLNNATYADALREIQWNQAWFKKTSFPGGEFTANGLIPPAITGLHNGDTIQAWTDAGLANAVGDNTRPVLRNPNNPMYSLQTTVSDNGFDGYNIIPRFATRIYFNCDTALCTTTEWINTSAGQGNFTDLLAVEKKDTSRHLFGLYHDGYMFHQANLRNVGVDPVTVNGASSTMSIFQAWVETVTTEFSRLANWPMISLTQTDLSNAFLQRQQRDACNYKLTYSTVNGTITGATISSSNNVCSAPIPLTLPGKVVDTKGMVTEQVGNDPLTIWVTLKGQPVNFVLASPVTL